MGEELRPLGEVQRRVEGEPHRQARRRLPLFWGEGTGMGSTLL